MPQIANPSLSLYISELKRRLDEVDEAGLGEKLCHAFFVRAEKTRTARWMTTSDEREFLTGFIDQNQKVTLAFGDGDYFAKDPHPYAEVTTRDIPVFDNPVQAAFDYLAIDKTA